MAIQIPNQDVSGPSKVVGKALVKIASRQDPTHAGQFTVAINAVFNPPPVTTQDYPTGTVEIGVDMVDSLKGMVIATSVEQINSFGKYTPTAILTGKCKVELQEKGTTPVGCWYWLMVADNKEAESKGTPDVASFVVFDRTGTRVAHGTGPLADGDIHVDPAP